MHRNLSLPRTGLGWKGRLCLMLAVLVSQSATAQDLPFQHKVEVYRSDSDGVAAFTVRLEQPFLAEEFEQSNYLRLRSNDDRAYLIYPKQTKFQQKHAEFFGRLRGEGEVELTLAYETVSENLDGTRRVESKEGTITVEIPKIPAGSKVVGSRSLFENWARQQNGYFARMLEYYPDESFFQYCLLQSKARYGVDPPPLTLRQSQQTDLETDLYEFLTGSLAIQRSLQRQTLSESVEYGDQTLALSSIATPSLKSLDYEALLQKQREQQGPVPRPHAVSRLVPNDYYLLHFQSMPALGKALDLATNWGDSLMRLYTVQAQDNRLQEKFEEQWGLDRERLEQLAEQGIIGDVALTGADPFLLEGTDLTLLLSVTDPSAFEAAAAEMAQEALAHRPDGVERQFNYRGHQVVARYTNDRVLSCFMVAFEGYVAYSNSHRSIRRVIDASLTPDLSLHQALDYRYVTTRMPPLDQPGAGYLYASEAFIKRMIGPSVKIAQKRRLQCFNNLVMQNNASLLYRLEYGRSPDSLSELIEGRFVDPQKIVCPHGGAYTFDSASDTCTCSLHNRLKYLTPNIELPVARVSADESQEYARYRSRYQRFWKKVYTPLAWRIQLEPAVKLESCILPFANSDYYQEIQALLDNRTQAMDTSRIAPSAFSSLLMVPGRENTAQFLRWIPGLYEIVEEDPTLRDLSWIGDSVGLHLCDGETILEFDPTQLRTLQIPMLGEASTPHQALAGGLLMMTNLPVYATLDIENAEKGKRLVQQFSERIFLKQSNVADLETRLDAYRLPDYREHAITVLNLRLYAVALRLHVALVGKQLVLATKPEVLREVIDASLAPAQGKPVEAQLLARINHRALDRLYDDVQLYWAEKSRVACHKNIISIANFVKLYDAQFAEIPQLSEAKYGVRYYCPDCGEYSFDEGLSQVVCSVHGNREHSKQNYQLDEQSSFFNFIHSLDRLTLSLRVAEEATIMTVDIARSAPPVEENR